MSTSDSIVVAADAYMIVNTHTHTHTHTQMHVRLLSDLDKSTTVNNQAMQELCCSAHFRSLRDLEIALRKFEIHILRTNLEIAQS